MERKKLGRRTTQNGCGEAAAGPCESSNGIGRRSFLSKLGGAAAATVATGLLASPPLAGAIEVGPQNPGQRRAQVFKKRLTADINERIMPPRHPTNGDEERYSNKIANFSKALPHNSLGEVDTTSYAALINALTTGSSDDFEAITLGGVTKLSDPQACFAYAMEGADSHVEVTRIPPPYRGNEQGSEMAENYWMALARDVAFADYDTDPTIAAAVADLGTFPAYTGPQPVTSDNIFRGNTPGDLIGPYVSQFFTLDVPYGSQVNKQQMNTTVAGDDHMFDYTEWLNIQNGALATTSNVTDPQPRYIRNLRDLGQWVHVDWPYEAGLNSALILNGMKATADPNSPYLTYTKQGGLVTFGIVDVLDLVGRTSAAVLKAAWFQKWLVHRRVRPEEYAGNVHNQLIGAASYPLPARLLSSPALTEVFAKFGTYLLPMAYAEGCPAHPSFPAGHPSLSGGAATVLKAFYDESFVIPSPMVASSDGLSLVPYTGATLTIGNELNKMAANVGRGRDAAGVHWRSDGISALRLGEAIAIAVLTDLKANYWESFAGWNLTKFDGTSIVI
jgi:hypothetical protein